MGIQQPKRSGNTPSRADRAEEWIAEPILCASLTHFAQLFAIRSVRGRTARNLIPELIEFRAHRKTLQSELQRRDHPLCNDYWLCGSDGFALWAMVCSGARRKAYAACSGAPAGQPAGMVWWEVQAIAGRSDRAHQECCCEWSLRISATQTRPQSPLSVVPAALPLQSGATFQMPLRRRSGVSWPRH